MKPAGGVICRCGRPLPGKPGCGARTIERDRTRPNTRRSETARLCNCPQLLGFFSGVCWEGFGACPRAASDVVDVLGAMLFLRLVDARRPVSRVRVRLTFTPGSGGCSLRVNASAQGRDSLCDVPEMPLF